MPDSQIKVDFLNHMGDDLSVVNAARVSFDKQSDWEDYDPWSETPPKLSERDTKLIHYLAKHEHFSPFGHCFASFRVTAPVFVRAQMVKHKFLRVNEISRRYVDSGPEFFTPDVWRGKAKDKKQGSDGAVKLTLGTQEAAYLKMEMDKEFYETLLSEGVAPEQARMVLPQSMLTSWVWSGSLDAFANMVNLRIKPDAQYETRLVAQQIDTFMRGIYPVSWGALVNETN